ncbi:MAG: hypothetical protein IH595_12445 [Bacteroidales bacterium]|nr:hypothetical protein [Bacteroidales bacterium]
MKNRFFYSKTGFDFHKNNAEVVPFAKTLKVKKNARITMISAIKKL